MPKKSGTKLNKSLDYSETALDNEDAVACVSLSEKKSLDRPKNYNCRIEISRCKNPADNITVGTSKVTQIKGSSKKVVRLESESSSINALDKDNYEVEEIVDFQIDDGVKYFLIRWKGYDANVDSWEKERSLNCAELIEKFYETHPEARIPTAKRKRNNDSDYAVSSNDSDIDLATIKRYGNEPAKETDCTSDEESSESEVDFEIFEPKVKNSVGRPRKHAVAKVVSTTKKLVGRPRKHDLSGGEENYEVEKIIDFGFEDGIKYFLIRWKGYDSSVDSWEKYRSLNCPELIAEFYKEHPEARYGATKRKSRKQTVHSNYSVSSSDGEYIPTYCAERTLNNSRSIKKRDENPNESSNDNESNHTKSTKRNSKSVKKRGRKPKVKRKSERKTNFTSTYKMRVNSDSESEFEDSEYSESEVEVTKSFERNTLANVLKKRPKRNGDRNEFLSSKDSTNKRLVSRSKVYKTKGLRQEVEGEQERLQSDSDKEPPNHRIGRPRKQEATSVSLINKNPISSPVVILKRFN